MAKHPRIMYLMTRMTWGLADAGVGINAGTEDVFLIRYDLF